jgi:hypothetical protein
MASGMLLHKPAPKLRSEDRSLKTLRRGASHQSKRSFAVWTRNMKPASAKTARRSSYNKTERVRAAAEDSFFERLSLKFIPPQSAAAVLVFVCLGLRDSRSLWHLALTLR